MEGSPGGDGFSKMGYCQHNIISQNSHVVVENFH